MIVAVVLQDPFGRVVLQLRDESPNIINAGKIGLFGGGALQGETPKEAALRELDEELQLRLCGSALEEVEIQAKEGVNGEQVPVYVFRARIDNVDSMRLNEGVAIVLANPLNVIKSSHMAPLSKNILIRLFGGGKVSSSG